MADKTVMGKSTQRQRRRSDGPDFRVIKQRFIELNRRRLQRIEQDLRPLQQSVFRLLPLLLHVNHPMLPGYVSRDAPTGVPDYSPDAATLKAARRVARSFTYRKRAYRKFDIQAIFLMGSTGTIAYSESSDFDIWVCHDPALNAEQLQELEQKVRGIEAWAAEMGVTASLFLIDPERFRRGEHARLSRESSGSALHFLLLDEFYRTSVLLAGRFPVWWLVPPDKEGDYEAYTENLRKKRFVYSRDHVDLGGLSTVPAEEFYGATLWLLYKGIDSPYKSVLKILLMEAYAAEYPRMRLLGNEFKQRVYDNDCEIDDVDPYLMMLKRVEAYLEARGETERLELVRRCFYLKVDVPLSEEEGHDEGWRRELLGRLCAQWRWHPSRLHMLDTREQWKLKRVRAERQELIGELTRSYRFLSDFARSHAGALSLIKPTDLNVLGRKLYATFERKAGKIEILFKGITRDLFEERLSIHRLKDESGTEIWAAYGGLVKEEDLPVAEALRRAHSVVELIAWCYFNRILSPNTVVALYAEGSDLSDRELRSVIEQFVRFFPDARLYDAQTEDYHQPVRIARVTTFINVGLDPFASYTRKGQHMTSSRTDALKYGGLLENLALSIDQVIQSSWQETLTSRYLGIKGLMECLREYISWAPPSQGRPPPAINAVSFSSLRSNSIAQRVEAVFSDVTEVLYDVSRPRNTVYIIAAERSFYSLWIERDALHYIRIPTIEELHSYLSRYRPEYFTAVFDRDCCAGEVLPVVYRHNRPNRVQYFYRVRRGTVEIFILDERGSLYQQSVQTEDYICLASHFQQFFESVDKRMAFLNGADRRRMEGEALEILRLEKNWEGEWFAELNAPVARKSRAQAVNLQAIVDLIDERTIYTIYYGSEEFSSLTHGDDFYAAVVRAILAERGSREPYPVYITDLDLSPGIIKRSGSSVQTIHFLHYKNEIETGLNRALAVLSAA